MLHRKLLSVILVVPCFLYAGSFGELNRNVSDGASFISLSRNLKSFEGYVVDESVKYHLKDLCFGGIVKIGGIRKEGDDSTSRVFLEDVKEIEVIDGRYKSTDPRHAKTKMYPLFVKVRVLGHKGPAEEYLFPYELVISGVDIKTSVEGKPGIGKAWFLRDVNKITIVGEYKRPSEVVEPSEKKETKKKPAKKLSWWQTVVPGA